MQKQYKLLILLTLAAFLSLNGCAYYNYLYNANKNFKHGMDSKALPNATTGAGKADFDKVIDGCATMLDYYPDSRWVPEALILMAKAYYESDQYSKSERKCVELENNYPTSKFVSDAKLYKAKCWLALKKTQEGRDLLIALQSDKDPDVQFSARLLLADALMADSLYPQALEQYNGMVGKAPTKELEQSTLQKRLDCLTQMQRYDDEIVNIDKLLKTKLLRPKQHEYRVRRAQLWIQTGNAKKALTDLTKLYKDGSFRNLRDSTKVSLAEAYFAANDTSKALKYWDELLSNDRAHNDVTAQAAYDRGTYRYETNADDTVITADWTRAHGDRPGNKYAILADTALAHYRWNKSIADRYTAARSQYDVLIDLLQGRDVPDSIRNRYLYNVRPPRPSDTVSVPLTTQEQKEPAPEEKPAEPNTEQSKTGAVSIAPSKVEPDKELLPKATQVAQNEEKKLSDTTKASLSTKPAGEVRKPEKTEQVSIRPTSLAPVVLDSTKHDTSVITTSVPGDTTKQLVIDTTKAAQIVITDTTKHDTSTVDTTAHEVQAGLDTTAIRTAIAEASKNLVHVLEEKKDWAFYQKDTSTAMGYYPELLEITDGKTHSAYQLEFAVMLRSEGDSVRADSLYHIIANDSLYIPIANAARKAINLALIPEPVDTMKLDLRGAEWVLDAFQDTTSALNIYQELAKKDSGKIAEKANAALAILNIHRVSRDSLEKLFDHLSKVAKSSKNVTFARQMVSYIQEEHLMDSLNALPDSLKPDSLKAPKDTTGIKTDSLKLAADSTFGKRDSVKSGLDTLKSKADTSLAKRDTAVVKTDTLTPKLIAPVETKDSTKVLRETKGAIPIDTTKKAPVDTSQVRADSTKLETRPVQPPPTGTTK